MSWFLNCLSCGDEWDQKERSYIREMNKYKDSAKQLKEEKDAMANHFSQDYLNWQAKEEEYLEQINNLQNQLHQSDVVMQQYKISEGNFHLDRQQLQENQKQVDKYEKLVSVQTDQIQNLKLENKKYLEAILELTRAAIGSEKRREAGLNGDIPHITESVLV